MSKLNISEIEEVVASLKAHAENLSNVADNSTDDIPYAESCDAASDDLHYAAEYAGMALTALRKIEKRGESK